MSIQVVVKKGELLGLGKSPQEMLTALSAPAIAAAKGFIEMVKQLPVSEDGAILVRVRLKPDGSIERVED